ncbi:MAG: hypothetical protein QM723_37885 [Myxococcaceae bacterium]
MRRLALICLLSLAGCNCTFDENLGNGDSGTCTKDNDCPGTTICVNKACVLPADAGALDGGVADGGSMSDGGAVDAGADAGAWDGGIGDAGSDGGSGLDAGPVFDAGGFVFDAGCDPLDGGCGYDGGVGSFCSLLAQFGCGHEAQCNFLALAQWNECTSFLDRWCRDHRDPISGAVIHAPTESVSACLAGTLASDCRSGREIEVRTPGRYRAGAPCYEVWPSANGQSEACSFCDGGYCPLIPGACTSCTPWLDAGAPCNASTGGCDPNSQCILGTCQPRAADGAQCTHDAECRSGYCNSTADAGTRFCGWLPIGATCAASWECTPDAFCDATGGCVPRIALGSACDMSINFGDTCDGGFCRDNICKTVGALSLGDVCAFPPWEGPFECAEPYYCAASAGLPTNFGRCALRLGLNSFCGISPVAAVGTVVCQAGLVCDLNGRCSPYPRAGEACFQRNSTLSRFCSEMLECLDTADGGVCELYNAVGSSCVAPAVDPKDDVVCLDSDGAIGFCRGTDAGFFCLPQPPGADGENCTPGGLYDTCLSHRCLDVDGGLVLTAGQQGTCAPGCP